MDHKNDVNNMMQTAFLLTSSNFEASGGGLKSAWTDFSWCHFKTLQDVCSHHNNKNCRDLMEQMEHQGVRGCQDYQ